MWILPEEDSLEHKEPQIRPKVLVIQVNDGHALKVRTEPNPFRHNHQHSIITKNIDLIQITQKLIINEIPALAITQIQQSFPANRHLQVPNLRQGKWKWAH